MISSSEGDDLADGISLEFESFIGGLEVGCCRTSERLERARVGTEADLGIRALTARGKRLSKNCGHRR